MSGFLLDTCVVSEIVKPSPHEGVLRWIDSLDKYTTFLSVMTIAEVRKGVEKRARDRRRDFLETWLFDDLPRKFKDRILNVDIDTAHHYGRIVANVQSQGRSVGVIDAIVAATALHHNLAVVTRNAGDFEPLGVSVVNPWL